MTPNTVNPSSQCWVVFITESRERHTAERYGVSKSNQTISCASISLSHGSWQRWNDSRWVGGNISQWSIIYGQRNFSRGLLGEGLERSRSFKFENDLGVCDCLKSTSNFIKVVLGRFQTLFYTTLYTFSGGK